MKKVPVLLIFLALLFMGLGADEPVLAITGGVVCKSITGYESYVELPDAALTSEDKLLVYYRPVDYKIERTKTGGYRAHFIQDGRIRKRGQKAVVWTKDQVLDYEARKPEPLGPIYLSNTIILKNLKPGDYDLEIILRDTVAEQTATQILRFQIVPAKPDAPEKPKN